MTPERRAEIEKLLEKYNRGYFYNINIDARAAIRDALAEIDRLGIELGACRMARWLTGESLDQIWSDSSDHHPDHEPDLEDEGEVQQAVPPPRVE